MHPGTSVLPIFLHCSLRGLIKENLGGGGGGVLSPVYSWALGNVSDNCNIGNTLSTTPYGEKKTPCNKIADLSAFSINMQPFNELQNIL
jgi:hypothetical protein